MRVWLYVCGEGSLTLIEKYIEIIILGFLLNHLGGEKVHCTTQDNA